MDTHDPVFAPAEMKQSGPLLGSEVVGKTCIPEGFDRCQGAGVCEGQGEMIGERHLETRRLA
ncbi:hypothetical protein D9M73_138000 [compost metagenome]